MELLMPQTNNYGQSTPPRRKNVIFTLYILLVWFILTLLGSLFGLFVQPPGLASLPIFPLSLIPMFAVPLSLSLHFAGLGQFWSLSKKQTT